MKRLFFICMVIFATVLFLGTQVYSAIVEYQPGSVKGKDAGIFYHDPDRNTDNSALYVGKGWRSNILYEYQALIEFDLGPELNGAVITNSTLSLYGRFYDYPGNSCTLNALMITSPWVESTVTWNTKPTYSNSSNYQAKTILLADNNWHWVDFDVTNMVDYWLSTNNYGTYITGSDLEVLFFGSDADSSPYRPKLTVEYEPAPVPEPATMIMLSNLTVGLCSMVGLRKRFFKR